MSEIVADVPKLLKASEVARILRVSKAQVYRLMRAGELRCVRFGQQTVRVRQEDLELFIKDNSMFG
jgi:excisionase family DNA binding protein